MELLTCTKCSGEKPGTSEFFPLHNKKQNGLDSWCRACRGNYRSEIRRGSFRRFGYSDDFVKGLTAVKECTICGVFGKSLAVDHCHKTGKIRGVLCFDCNLGLGKFKDDPDLLEFARIYILSSMDDVEADVYLEKHSPLTITQGIC